MKQALLAGFVAVAVSAFAATAHAADQEAIDKAVERGVAFVHKGGAANSDFNSTTQPVGAAALAGLTLLECGVAPDDAVVRGILETVRSASPSMHETYTLSLAILFLDRLGDPADVPLIESMTVRLMAGQGTSGGWSYTCPDLSESEVRRLTTHLKEQRELIGRRERPPEIKTTKEPNAKPVRRSVKDLPKEIRAQLAQIGLPTASAPFQGAGDNSNTQFATIALWVGRRQGLPVETALARIEQRFRVTQNPDGGWVYNPTMGRGPSSATMTCSGLLGLAVAHGAAAEAALENGKKPADPARDRAIRRAVALLGTAVGRPFDRKRIGPPPLTILAAQGRTYYFLWSLERVCVAFDLKTIGRKDWYTWGSDVLLVNQAADGSWQGDNSATVDTCFALLFLKRANLARDLTARLKGQLRDPGEAVLKAGGNADDLMKGQAGFKSGVASQGDSSRLIDPAKVPIGGRPAYAPDAEAAMKARALYQAPAERFDPLLEKYRDSKGVTFTEALAAAIPQLDGAEARSKTREALAQRLTRMTSNTLIRYLQDPDAEIRRAAALAVAKKENNALIPDLIPLLNDPVPAVAQAAHAALKAMSGEALGPSADEWKAWWRNHQGK